MIREYSKYKPFRFWCQKVLPLVYDDSLSYYELLNKVVDYLNNVIKDVNALGTAFEELNTMVTDYFENLDVQEEIDNKLDSMVEDGTLDAMIQPLVGDAVSEWLEDNVTPTGSAVLVDTTLTISGAAADAKKTGDEISDLKSDLNQKISTTTGNTPIEYTSGHYINLSGSTANIDSPIATWRYSYAVVPCVAGDIFTINATTTTSEIAYGFVSQTGTVLQKTSPGPSTYQNTVAIAPTDSAYLVINTSTPNNESYHGRLLVSVVDDIGTSLDGLEPKLTDLQNDVFLYTGNKQIEFTRGAYIRLVTNTQLSLDPVPSTSWEYAIIDCEEGDMFTLSGTGTANERMWGFIDSTNTIVTIASTAITANKLILTAPTNAVKLVINNKDFSAKSYVGAFLNEDINRRISLHNNQNVTETEKYWEPFDYYFVDNRAVTKGEVNYNFVGSEKKSYHITRNDTSTCDVRFQVRNAINLTGVNAVRLLVYIVDVSKFNNVTVQILSTNYSRTLNRSQLKDGWNELTFYTVDGDISTWDTFNILRLVTTGTEGRDMYVAKISLYRPPIGNIIFVEDSGYVNFLENGYPDLKAIGVPTTWALDPGQLGVDARISQEQVETLSQDSASEFSFHAWTSNTPTSGMSAEQLSDETVKCLTYLRKNGLLPKYIWRAAFTQNNAPQYMALTKYLEAMATATSNSSPTSFPFPNKYNIPRFTLHSQSQSDIDLMFTKILKTHCTYVIYTHRIGTSGEYDMTQANWDYFISALTTALSEGYVRGTTFNQLMMEYYG